MTYKLNFTRDVDISNDEYILNLPKGFRFYDEIVHVRGYDSIEDLKESVRKEVIQCNCDNCKG